MAKTSREQVKLGTDIMVGHYGPTPEENGSEQMQEFVAALLSPKYYQTIAVNKLYAAICGDGRFNVYGQRFAEGYFAFGGGYMPVLGEALADPEPILKQGLRLDTHAHLRLRQRQQRNPNAKLVWHTADSAPADGIGCGLLAGREAVAERIAGAEMFTFADKARELGLMGAHDLEVPTRLQQNARRLLDGGYLNIADRSLREVPQDIKGLTIEEVLVHDHGEKRFLVNSVVGQRLNTALLAQDFNGWEVFVTDSGNLKAEALDWARMTTGDIDEKLTQHTAARHFDAMGAITLSGIAILGNKNLDATLR
jgi:hypothetical protein